MKTAGPRVENVTLRLKRFLATLDFGVLFTTRQVLNFGKRAAVDMALCRMVKKGDLQRVAVGMYCRRSHRTFEFDPFIVAQTRARAFAKQVLKLTECKPELL